MALSSEHGYSDHEQKRVVSPAIVHEEYQYLHLVQRVLERGEERNDRTGTGTMAVFSPEPTEWTLANGTLPLLTTKAVPFQAVANELLFFISGRVDTQWLKDHKVSIWDANTSRQSLDAQGKTHIPTGHIGKGYGFQWRHFGGEYGKVSSDGKPDDILKSGVDQLAKVIEDIKLRPHSRRHIVTAWNPAQEQDMALPPCHLMFQFYVHNDETLSCAMTQRSCDLMLGVPFNIASYSLLTHMVAHVTGLKARTFHHHMMDTHIYNDHREGAKVQLDRTPYPFPSIEFKRPVSNIDEFTLEDFQLTGYQHHPKIVMKMSV